MSSTSKALELRHPASLKGVSVHFPASGRKAIIFGCFLVLHAIAFKACVDTSGHAYELALEKMRKINRDHVLNGTLPEDIPPQDVLPSTWSPNAWASAAMFASVSLHVLFYLLCHWKVGFKASMLFSPASRVSEGCYLLVQPQPHRGQAQLVPLWFNDDHADGGFTFQRQRYEYFDPKEDEEVGEVRLVKSPVDNEISTYLQARGLRGHEVDSLRDRFGDNRLQVQMPTFVQCYRDQLTTPLVVFQIFATLLWAADDFISYTLMNLFYILMFESTTVFQRLRTMKMLNNMGTKPYPVNVFRSNEWVEVSTADLLPGDLVELTATPPAPAAGANATAAPTEPVAQVAMDIVPCDCVVIRGEAVASEASLTGESAPQMKDSLPPLQRCLNMQGDDRVHSLFSGTRLLRASEERRTGLPLLAEVESELPAGESPHVEDIEGLSKEVPPTPGGGCLCYVVRTGFSSSQGELLQMIEFSQEKVQGDTKETIIALLVLLAFALAAAAYVLKVGLEKGDKTPHELLIKCIIIVTAVVPRGLPMQMAIAVNTALVALSRNGVYCIEPYRVPFAGKLTHAFFDKTGTLTTDTLVPVGVTNAESEISPSTGFPVQSAVSAASLPPTLVLASCHSLVSVDGHLSGDPIEVAALEGVGWRYDPDREVAMPLDLTLATTAAAVEDGEENEEKEEEEEEKDKKEGEEEKKEGEEGNEEDKKAKTKKKKDKKSQADAELEDPNKTKVHVVRRFHFASQLQRMAVIADLSLGQTTSSSSSSAPASLPLKSTRYCFVKGSPEAVGNLLLKGTAPPWYDKAHTCLAEGGLRVLALAIRELTEEERTTDVQLLKREAIEKDLIFVGFIAFECKARADSGLVLTALRDSAHCVAMVTGDAPLTALHVARTCGIVDESVPGLLLTMTESGPEWHVGTGDSKGEKRPLVVEEVPSLTKDYALVATGDALDAAVKAVPELWTVVDSIRVFARMTPQGKAEIIRQVQKQQGHVLMCGDGGNDVGALKQADVGLALLAGYGNTNTTEIGEGGESKDAKEGGNSTEAEVALNARTVALAKKTKEAAQARKNFLWAKQKELNGLNAEWLAEETDKANAALGENAGAMASMAAQAGAVKKVLARYTAELKKEMREYDAKHGNIYDDDDGASKKDAAAKMQENLDSMQNQSGMPMVRPGDASIAAPFTSRAPSVKSCIDLIRQGRCTLLGALQQQQIMMLNCIINAYVLSALSLEGSRNSERQLMASNWLLAIASLAFAYSAPCDRMHPVRPLRSLFHPAVFVSLLGQAVIHLACMVCAVRMCRAAMEPGSPEREGGWEGPSLDDVKEFWRIERLKRKGVIEEEEEMDWTQLSLAMWFRAFIPNLMNTVVFLVETAQTVAILFVNYKGQPWMKGVMENRPLFFSVFVTAGGVAAAAWELSPKLNELIHLSPFPNDQFRWNVMGLVGITLVGTFIWDRICVAIFAPEIFSAMVKSARQTTFMKDIVPLFKMFGIVLVVLFVLATGNLILFGLTCWQLKKRYYDDP